MTACQNSTGLVRKCCVQECTSFSRRCRTERTTTVFCVECHTSFLAPGTECYLLFSAAAFPDPHSWFLLGGFSLWKKPLKVVCWGCSLTSQWEVVGVRCVCVSSLKQKLPSHCVCVNDDDDDGNGSKRAGYSWSESVHHSLTGREQSPVRYTKQATAFSQHSTMGEGLAEKSSALCFYFHHSHHYIVYTLLQAVVLTRVFFFSNLIFHEFILNLLSKCDAAAQETPRGSNTWQQASELSSWLQMAPQIKWTTVWCRLVT